MSESEMVECPACGGEGMKKHCGQTVACDVCHGMGEIDRDTAEAIASA